MVLQKLYLSIHLKLSIEPAALFLAHKAVLTFRCYEKMDGNVGCDKIWAKVQLTINNTSLSSENSEFTNGFKWIFLQPYGISEN